ncbi:DUF4058 family protein [Tautonia rosea]|uniref:DUF4058 family protein n=1 Tax=Tautonia rosea TaxID=2728037 RepID=UPI001474F902|nr:DUF4058 family protein [Tautonia rosea]
MPIHDWTRVNAGLFHHFHHQWIASLANALNAGLLPGGYSALAEQRAIGLVPDVLTLQHGGSRQAPGGLAVAERPPRAWAIRQAEEDVYAAKANRIAIHHPLGEVVAVIEIVSPGNKGSRAALRSFTEKAVELVRGGIHLLVVDLFPPSDRDPLGIHPAIWDAFLEEPFEPPPGKTLTVVSYASGDTKVAYVEPVGVGDLLPEMPLFLTPGTYIPAPLEATYQATWDHCPAPLREAVTGNRRNQ